MRAAALFPKEDIAPFHTESYCEECGRGDGMTECSACDGTGHMKEDDYINTVWASVLNEAFHILQLFDADEGG